MTTPRTANAILKVVHPGLCTLVVDGGRPCCRSLGVPVGGAADRAALALGNALVGNPPDAAALEVALAGPTLVADAELACVLFGAPFDLATDRRPLAAGKTFTLRPGEVLHVGGTARGVRAYLCVGGGLQTPVVLGSRSSLEPLKAGTELDCIAGRIQPRFIDRWDPSASPALSRQGRRMPLCVLPGAQAAWFSPEWWVQKRFTVAPSSNRMGLRLTSDPLSVPDRELVSEPVCPGTVQVTRDGQCIVLGVDGQTIGGYPKIAHVCSFHLPMLGQLRPGDRIGFAPLALDRAVARYRKWTAYYQQYLKQIRAAAAPV